MTKLFNNNGFTLTEVLVSLSILIIISVAFLTLFANSYSDIATSGRKNIDLYKIQQQVEEAIAIGTTSQEKELNISFPGLSNSIKIKGSVETKEITLEKGKISISVFIPKNAE